MADWVSPWVGLAGTAVGAIVVFHSQQAARIFQAQRDDQQLFRDRAQAVFAEIAVIRDSLFPSLASVVQYYATKDEKVRGEIIPSQNMAKLKSLIAVYFPMILPAVRNFELVVRSFSSESDVDKALSSIEDFERRIVNRSVFVYEQTKTVLDEIESILLMELSALPMLSHRQHANKRLWLSSLFKPKPAPLPCKQPDPRQ